VGQIAAHGALSDHGHHPASPIGLNRNNGDLGATPLQSLGLESLDPLGTWASPSQSANIKYFFNQKKKIQIF